MERPQNSKETRAKKIYKNPYASKIKNPNKQKTMKCLLKKIRKSEDQNTVCSIDQFNYRNNYIVYLSVIGLILNVIVGFLLTTMFISRDTYFRFDAGQKM